MMKYAPTVDLRRPWRSRPLHRRWLADQALSLLALFQGQSLDSKGGFYPLDNHGHLLRSARYDLVFSARMVHAYSLASLLGMPGSDRLVEHGLSFLWGQARDPEHGGYFWEIPTPDDDPFPKKSYGHAFVLLAASTATLAGYVQARSLLEDVYSVIDSRFWSEQDGLYRDEASRDWSIESMYRGQNANMHLVEALMAMTQATGYDEPLNRAYRIARRLIKEITVTHQWRLCEHYTAEWKPDLEYNRLNPNHVYRPFGSIVGHWFEWARLLVHLNTFYPQEDWLLSAAQTLFQKGVEEGWDTQRGGILYTIDPASGSPLNHDRYWWVIAEAISAAAVLSEATGDSGYELWYRRFWNFTARFVIDRHFGGWHPVLTKDNQPAHGPWTGRPDLYHALQACLIPLYASTMGVALAIQQDGDDAFPDL